MRRGEIYRTRERVPERGAKPGFYVVVSRTFVAEHEDVSTVICAPIYGEILGLTTEVVLGPEDRLPRACAMRCDFLTLMFKSKLTHLYRLSRGSNSPNSTARWLTLWKSR